MPTAVPVRDLKNTAAFARLVDESPEPITVTKNGYDKFVAMRRQDYIIPSVFPSIITILNITSIYSFVLGSSHKVSLSLSVVTSSI